MTEQDPLPSHLKRVPLPDGWPMNDYSPEEKERQRQGVQDLGRKMAEEKERRVLAAVFGDSPPAATCVQCSKEGRVTQDDHPAPDELIWDTSGRVALAGFACGACLDRFQERKDAREREAYSWHREADEVVFIRNGQHVSYDDIVDHLNAAIERLGNDW